MDRSTVIDTYFMEHRAKIIDIAAFLDRYDRAADGPAEGDEDFRMRAFRDALALLTDGQTNRAARVLDLLSDHTTDPIPSAAGMKGADGACKGNV